MPSVILIGDTDTGHGSHKPTNVISGSHTVKALRVWAIAWRLTAIIAGILLPVPRVFLLTGNRRQEAEIKLIVAAY